MALLTFGEGWHNNHHAHPVSARHGLNWYEIDFNWYGIWALKKLAWPSQVYTAKISEIKRANQAVDRQDPQRESASRDLAPASCNALLG